MDTVFVWSLSLSWHSELKGLIPVACICILFVYTWCGIWVLVGTLNWVSSYMWCHIMLWHVWVGDMVLWPLQKKWCLHMVFYSTTLTEVVQMWCPWFSVIAHKHGHSLLWDWSGSSQWCCSFVPEVHLPEE